MLLHGFLRVAAASPELRVADPKFNAARTLDLLKQAEGMGCDLVVFPEMGLTGYTCGDLFHDRTLQWAALDALDRLVRESADQFSGLYVVGLPMLLDDRLFNMAAVICRGRVYGLVPKSYLPTYREFYDARFFTRANDAVLTPASFITIADALVPAASRQLFPSEHDPRFVVGVEVCEDLWVPTPPSGPLALSGATVLVNPSASPETVGKAGYRKQLVLNQSARCIAGYVYAGAGPGESSQDLVFGGHCLIAENGLLLAESKRFRRDGHMVVADLDIDRLVRERAMTNTFHDAQAASVSRRYFAPSYSTSRTDLKRFVDPRPFVPSDPVTLDDRCAEIFQTQVSGLTTRLAHINATSVAIGVSGGLDSTLALLVACKAFDSLGKPRTGIKGLTMPGFGTTARTRQNADRLMDLLGTCRREIDIRQMSLDQMRAIGHAPFGIPLDGLTVETLTEKLRALPTDKRHDLTFENTQARVRTSLLMNTGFVVGTGDLSELAVGWCTYNADHMSMYNPNVGVPKTLVAFLVRWAARTQFDGPARDVLLDVADTVISPELLPAAADGSAQVTEDAVGPYELIDFFLYHFLRWGTSPEKILFLAGHAAFSKPYTSAELRRWLRELLRRFFANQFKRSALPDGPKVGSVTLSPRGDWRMPSDASASAWLEWCDRE